MYGWKSGKQPARDFTAYTSVYGYALVVSASMSLKSWFTEDYREKAQEM